MYACYYTKDASTDKAVDWLLAHTVKPHPGDDLPRIDMQPAMLVKAAGSLKTIEIRGRYEGTVTPMEVLRYQEMRLRLPEGKARELDGFLREQFARRRDGTCLEGSDEPSHSIPNETVAQPKVLEGKVLVTVQAEPNERVKVTVDYDEPALWLFVASLCGDIEAEWNPQSEKCDDPDCHYTAYEEYIGIYGLPAIEQTPASEQTLGSSRLISKPEPPPKPAKGKGLDAWFKWYHDMRNDGLRCTLKDVAKETGYTEGYLKQEHAKWMAEHSTSNT